jgi:hypothetical protein
MIGGGSFALSSSSIGSPVTGNDEKTAKTLSISGQFYTPVQE